MLKLLQDASVAEALLFFIFANFIIYFVSVASCWWLGKVFRARAIFQHKEPLEMKDIVFSFFAVIINSLVSVLGWVLWCDNYILINQGGLIRSSVDFVVMVLAIDFGMYVFHRIAHTKLIYRIIHSFHHRHEGTNPISLFVLHPIEVLGFGFIMIGFLLLYPMTIAGLLAYLTFNIIFGTLGHSGVEPFPSILGKIPLLRLVGTSTFHAEHHDDPHHNFGFYSLIWDKLFGTIDPRYTHHFAQRSESGPRD